MSEVRTLTRFHMRLLLLGFLMSLSVLAVAGRLFFLTVTSREALRERAEVQHQHTLKLDATRGAILDRHGRTLAASVEVESIYAVPRAFDAERTRTAAAKLATCLGLPGDRIARRLDGTKSFAWLERKAKPRAVECARELNLVGVGFLPETRRFYPKRTLASQVLGYVGIDNDGMSGVEFFIDREIRGAPGRRVIWSDARNRRAASRVDERPLPGRSAYLSIDENLQYIAEVELRREMEGSRAKSGIAILMRPATGELLAIASLPAFNPNRYGDYPESNWRNRAVTDVYEPGSTFKIVGAAAALQEGVTTEDERIDCGRGEIVVGDRVIHDHRYFDVLTFREVIELSSNVGMIRIGQRLGRDRLDAYVRAFGFGSHSGVELPAESRGILKPAARWGPVTQASISFGQEIGVTPLQMVTAANVIATSGYLMRPRLILGYGDAASAGPGPIAPQPVRRVIDPETARRVTELLLGVVERGTGQRARIPGYRVAGKTGTAQKAEVGGRGYSKTDYVASFVGFVPASRPELTALVILDSPEGDHSGSRAAGVFARIAARALRYLGTPPDEVPPVAVAKVWPQTSPILSDVERRAEGRLAEVSASSEATASLSNRVPNVSGLPARDALAKFVARGILPEIVGTGWVLEQWPPPGAPIESGVKGRLTLGTAAASPSVEPQRGEGERRAKPLLRAASARAGGPVQ